MSDRWVIDADYPAGRLVPMTPAEESQLAADHVVGLAAAALQETARANQATLFAAVSARMAALRQARSALSGGSIFASLSVNERRVIDALLQNDLQFARLVLELFDATDNS